MSSSPSVALGAAAAGRSEFQLRPRWERGATGVESAAGGR